MKRLFAAALALAAAIPAAAGQELVEAPQPWQTGFQQAASPSMQGIRDMNDLLIVIVTVITAFVLALLLYVIVRFNAKRNPTPSRTSHNTLIEMLWTVIPVIILVAIAIPSFKLLYLEDVVPDTEFTLKVTGSQWYWSYEYPDQGDFGFDAFMVPEEDLEAGQLRLLTTDNAVVLPVDTNIRIQVTAADVLHSWAVPAFGIKLDAVPGRLNETWVRIAREGTYYGQCSELCGVGHGFMPIMVKAVSKKAFLAWVEEAKTEFARRDAEDGTTVAMAPTAHENQE